MSPVVFVQLARGIGGCERLEQRVRSGPLARELPFPYHPHVTVAHDVADEALDRAFAELADYSAQFSVWGFSLYEHVDGVWRPQRDFPLGRELPGPGPRRLRAGVSTEDRAARVARLQERATGYALSAPLPRPAVAYGGALRRGAREPARGLRHLLRLPGPVPVGSARFRRSSASCRATSRSSTTPSSIRSPSHGAALGLTPEIVEQLQRAAVGLGLISLGFLLYAGVRFMEALREALALVFGGAPPRGKLAHRVGADLVLLLLVGLVFLGSVVAVYDHAPRRRAGWQTP